MNWLLAALRSLVFYALFYGVSAVLVIASDGDDDVPPAASAALAANWEATFWRVPGSHVGPLLGRQAPALAASVLPWLNAAVGVAGIQHPLGAPA